MENLLEIAQNKYINKNKIREIDFDYSIYDFILKLYVNCDPASYGKQFEKKLRRDLQSSLNTTVFYTYNSTDRGDIAISFPNRNMFYGGFSYHCPKTKKTFATINDSRFNDIVQFGYYETKLTFLGKNGGYTIRNLRPHQDVDGYIITTVDCENDFTPEYFFLTKEDLFENSLLTFSYMNGTKKNNLENNNVGVGTQFKKNSFDHRNIRKYSKLKEPTYEALVGYLEKEKTRLEKKFKQELKKFKQKK